MTVPSGTSRLVLLLSFLLACGGRSDWLPSGQGRVDLVLASSAGAGAALSAADGTRCPALQAASVTFSAVLARSTSGELVDVTIALPVTVDLLSLSSTRQATLPAGFLPPGTYDQFVVVMRTVELTLPDGTGIAITPPGGGWTAVVAVAQPFTVVLDQTTTVALRFRRDLSFACGHGGWEFHPKFECEGGAHR